ncbi:hypothetical protein Tco_0632868, partial [Tanacetum coccineum]
MACSRKSKDRHMRKKMIRICSKRNAKAYKTDRVERDKTCQICANFKLYLISLIISCHHTVFYMAQHVIPAAQLVPQYSPIRRCNNYAVFQSIPCYPECKIVGLILLDHCLSHALTVTADVPVIDTLHLPVETPENPFVAPANIHTIEAFINRVSYQGVVDKVSAFFMNNLAQPWQTMFKVFNRCLTTRTSSHDQTNINILQLFHVVLNQTHVDYAALLWWDFMNNVFQKKEVIQYPCFIKLIVVDLMDKFSNIPKRLEEDYHSIKDDVPLVNNLEVVNDDDDKEREKKGDEMGSLEIRNEEMQTTISTPLSSPRKILSSNKKTFQELTNIVSNPTTSTSKHSQVKKRISSKYYHLPGALHMMCRRQGYMIQDIERKCVTTAKLWETHNKIDDILHE